MTQLLGRDEFRAQLEDAIKGREAKNASFSKAWAEGRLERLRSRVRRAGRQLCSNSLFS